LPIIREKYNLPHKFILYLGNIEPRKNLGGLIRAYNHLRREQPDLSEYKLVIAGATGWKIGDTFVELNNSPYKDDVIFLGYVDKNDKAALYNLATVFVYPSFYEGFGFPPLEAMACGLPVVTSNISSLPEIVGGAALTIDPYNVQALSQAMIQVLDNEGLRDELSIKGLERAKNFSWQKTAQQYLDLFNTL
jgi:glycosyltransferase involved in cell wall biosynthesis